jgi:hypothetical protein
LWLCSDAIKEITTAGSGCSVADACDCMPGCKDTPFC